jgi:hypothetical protein
MARCDRLFKLAAPLDRSRETLKPQAETSPDHGATVVFDRSLRFASRRFG